MRGSNKTILIVDDGFTIRQVLKSIIKQLGEFDFLEANNGIEALEMMLKFKPDLVFLDILMPKLSGVEALKQLQNYPELKNIPIIICSAESNIKTVEKALTLGAVDYIVKPFTMEIVLKKAEKWLFPEDSSRNRS